ncbi:pyridine nucleotide-disulphide oxidoreductase domain protein [Afipia carboxidovorans OM5]|uniref:FAD-dependent pyridine nucleotide-disulfide oxidoreductase n=1 Tax=Afipia carboxidovorans (strain ATCC 49405 / DSM 1227 / KCTC 32145 / OM5) TaxID=504832 RepID=B6JAN3_AFIC5|nr:FAD-dependent oxidoreductase [Afipia carboxidovorans]ACI91402.1 pyridine nucleotide-disulphide oxidoreductase domain protein [Afipia carboxidovorans OM5]AEI01418.1 FAD-dependent pyridine nucleotide-disulfide oxidoreductase [Afipia carboxidovorans OM4]AEI04993.1 FAD-dependent pyridine nucleotide-disulfide oxidoreductase [Afipia carboxidovorans OM5]
MSQDQEPQTPDLTQGVTLSQFAGDKLLGHVGEAEVLLVRSGDEIFAVGAHCTHYHGPLADGVVVDGGIRCPWHHACFDLRTGEAVRAPAFDPIDCYRVEQAGDKIIVREKATAPARRCTLKAKPQRIVIVGGGAAGFAAAEMLRREQYDGDIVMLSQDTDGPVDRPNLSKDYLAGSAEPDWIPLRGADFYRDSKIDLRVGTEVVSIDGAQQAVTLKGGERLPYDRLLLATGAEPNRLPIPGGDLPHVHVLRTLTDSNAIIAQAKDARKVVVIGASFIGLEAAAALRAREIEVHIVAPETVPMARVLGEDMGRFVRALHEEHGVIFHLGEGVSAISDKAVQLKSGQEIAADLVVVGVGVKPRLDLAEKVGLAIDRGVVVDRHLQTSVPGIYAAGDIVRWPDPHSGRNIRVEHWVVAERQGQVAARNMLGANEVFDAVPFFWSQHYDIPINYVGHAEEWDEIVVHGEIAARDCLLEYKLGGKTLAIASIFRDADSLKAAAAMERGLAPV